MDEKLTLYPEEPQLGPWHKASVSELAQHLVPAGTDRRVIVAVDGRGGAGKTTLASALARTLPKTEVIHTDDLAWHEPLFAWDHLLTEVVETLRAGEALRFVPPAWTERGRAGAVSVDAATRVVVLEGTGSAGAAPELYDAVVWVQSDRHEARRRGLARDAEEGTNGTAEEAAAFWDSWKVAERAYLADTRPWKRAAVAVLGTPGVSTPAGTLHVYGQYT